MEFKDISTETRRTYTFPDGAKVTIEGPLSLNVSPSGGHRIADRQRHGHYVPAGWIHLEWEVAEGATVVTV